MRHYLPVGYDVEGADKAQCLDLLSWLSDKNRDQNEDEPSQHEVRIEEYRVLMQLRDMHSGVELLYSLSD